MSNHGARRFWTAYRQIVVETGLARGESVALIAQKLGINRNRVSTAIWRLKLRPRELLSEERRRAG